MANHQSAIKRIRSNEAKRLRNRYQLKACKASIKKFEKTTQKQEQEAMFKKVVAMLDKLAQRNVIHSNKAANKKSQLARQLKASA